MPLELGSQVGPYEIESAAGAGGMGEVYRAKDTRLDRWVAIKVLPAALSQDPDLRARFEREAKTISSLTHPNICSLYDIGQHEGADYLVMEFCEGETLAERLKSGPLPSDQLFRYGTQIAYALDKAHRQGIVHRDLKPGNVMLTRDGAKLLDFGLAKYSDAGSGSDAERVDSMTALPTEHQPLTEAGTLLGTFQYMAPEQLEGKDADARADIFAFGSLLYEMATGKPAFAGDSRASLIAAILERQPAAVSVVQPMAPPALDHVIQRCLEKDAEDRWQSAHDVARQLEWIAEGGSQIGVASPVVSRRKSRETLAWAVAAIGLALAALGLFSNFSDSEIEPQVSRTHVLPPEGTTFDFDLRQSGSLAISPNGRILAFTALEEDGNRSLWVRPVESLESRKLTGTEGAGHPFWSWDSRFLAFFANGQLKKVDIAGSPPLTLCDAADGRSGSWNANGVILFSPGTVEGIYRVDAGGGEPEPVTLLDVDQGETTHRWAHFLPDGKRFLYMAAGHALGTSSEFNAIYAGSLETDDKELIVRARSNAVYSMGHLLYVRDGVLIAHPFDADSLELGGDPFPLAAQIRYSAWYFRGVFSASTNGVLTYQTGSPNRKTQLTWLDRQGNQLALLGDPATYASFDLSPDDDRAVVEIADETSGLTDLWIHELERDVKSRFTFGELGESSPVWSHDGQRVAFGAAEKAAHGEQIDGWILIKNISGTQEVERVQEAETGAGIFANSWSPDDESLALTVFTGTGKSTVSVVPLSGDRSSMTVLDRGFFDAVAVFSPDGRWLSFVSNESGTQELYVIPYPGPGGKWQISSNGGYAGLWRDDEIIFQTPDFRMVSVPWEASGSEFRIGAEEELFQNPRVDWWDLTSDGQRFLVTLTPEDVSQPPLVLVSDWTAGRPL